MKLSRRTIVLVLITTSLLIFGAWTLWKPESPSHPITSVWRGTSLPCGGPQDDNAQVQFSSARTYTVHVADVMCSGSYRIVSDNTSPMLELRADGGVIRYTYYITGDILTLRTTDGATLKYTWQPKVVCEGAMCE